MLFGVEPGGCVSEGWQRSQPQQAAATIEKVERLN